MSCFNGLKLTKLGEILLANINGNLNETLTFTSGAVGAGAINDDNEINSLTALKDKWKDLDILSIEKDEDDETIVKLELQFSNVDLQEAKLFREIGIYAKGNNGEPVLFAYSNAGENYDYVPLPKDNPQTFTIQINLKITSNSKIDAIINMAGFVTIGKMVEFLKSKLTQIPTVIELQSKRNLKVGDIVEVLGYYRVGDGAGHKRIISNKDDGSGVQLTNNLWANIIHDGEINVSWVGVKGDGVSDDSDCFLKALSIAKKIIVSAKKYVIRKTLFLKKSQSILMHDAEIILDKDIDCFILNSETSISGGTISCNFTPFTKSIIHIIGDNNECRRIKVKDLRIRSIDTKGTGKGIFIDCTNSNVAFCEINNVNIYLFKYGIYVNNRINEHWSNGHYINACIEQSWCCMHHEGGGSDLIISGQAGNEGDSTGCVVITNSGNTLNCSIYDAGVGVNRTKYAVYCTETSSANTIYGMSNNNYLNSGSSSNIFATDLLNRSSLISNGYCQVYNDGSNNLLVNLLYKEKLPYSSFTHKIEMNNLKHTSTEEEFIRNITSLQKGPNISLTPIDTSLPVSIEFTFTFPTTHIASAGLGFFTNNYAFETAELHISKDGSAYELVETINAKTLSCEFNYFKDFAKMWAFIKGIKIILRSTKHTRDSYILKRLFINSVEYKDSGYLFSDGANSYGDIKYYTGFGPVIKSPDGTDYRIVVANGGSLSTTLASKANLSLNSEISELNTLYMGEKMKQEGVYSDYISYMDEKTLYDKKQRDLEKQKQLAYQESLKENPELTYEEFISLQPMTLNLSVIEEPQPSKALQDFMKKYL